MPQRRRYLTDAEALNLPSFCGPTLRAARLDAGLSLAEMGARLGCHATVVHRWEQALPHVSERTVIRYAAALGLRPRLVLEP